MTEGIHHVYRDILQEARKEGFGGGQYRSGIYFPSQKTIEPERNKVPIAFVCLVAGLGVILGLSLYTRGFSSQAVEAEPKVSHQVIENEETIDNLRRELEIMKRILSGLVSSVETITRETKNDEDGVKKSKFPYPVKVTSDRAHLRDSPSRFANSLTTVEKNTVLLTTKAHEEWLKVLTPKGEEAWISADIVTERRE
jgi:hypothetical protein